MERITKEHIIRLILFGSCQIPKIGTSIRKFSMADLIWAERILTRKEKENLKFPLWTFSKHGYGAGDGAGYGAGAGAGDGYGAGYGASDGYGGYGAGYGASDGYGGYGAGYGAGAGYGGYGAGAGAGYGDGDGDGDGAGYGAGYKDIGGMILNIDFPKG